MFREWWQSFLIQNHKISTSVWQCAQQSHRSVSCFSRIWMAQTQGCPLLQGPTFWGSQCNLLNHPLIYALPLGQADTIFFFNLASYYQSTTSSQIPQNYSTQVEAAIHHLVNLYLQSPTPTSLWAFISTRTMWLQRAWATFPKNWPRRSTRELRVLKMQNQHGSHAARTCRSHLQMSEGKPRTPWKLHSHGQEPEPGSFRICTLWVLPTQTPTCVTSWRATS